MVQRIENRSVTLETERLLLREMAPSDLDSLHEVLSDAEAMRFYPEPFDRSMSQAWIERNIQRYAKDGFGLWALILRRSGELVGDCGLVLQSVEGEKVVEIGYHVRRDLWGQGLATEAARACCDYGFNQLGCTKLISLIHPDNTSSQRVAQKLGMSLRQTTEWQNKPVHIYEIERGGKA